MNVSRLTNEIFTRFKKRKVQRPFIIGIDGLGGAGKTTLARQLRERLEQREKVIVIHMDEHIVKRSKRYNTGHEEWYEYYFLQWDVDMLEESLFMKIHRHASSLTLPFYEKSTDETISKTISLALDTIILIEGVFLQRKEWKAYLDFTVFIDCKKGIRHERVVKRDTYLGDERAILEKYNRRYWRAETYYLEEVQPERTADISIQADD